jgi:hypothetical protein
VEAISTDFIDLDQNGKRRASQIMNGFSDADLGSTATGEVRAEVVGASDGALGRSVHASTVLPLASR